MLLYSILHLTGYGVSLDDIKNFRQLGSPAAGHPEYGHAPGIETTTGPLGQGISTSVGMALGERMLVERFDEELVGHYTYVIASDGDLEEGIASEASSLAGHLGLGRLIVFYDDNHISIEGDTALAFSEDVGKRYEAYGWHVQNLHEDLALDSMEAAVERRAGRGRPAEHDHPAHAHRARLAEQAGHARGARLAARRGGDPAHQAGLQLAQRGAVLHPRRGARRTSASPSTAGTSSTRSGSRSSSPHRIAPSWSGSSRAGCPTAGTATSRRRARTRA